MDVEYFRLSIKFFQEIFRVIQQRISQTKTDVVRIPQNEITALVFQVTHLSPLFLALHPGFVMKARMVHKPATSFSA